MKQLTATNPLFDFLMMILNRGIEIGGVTVALRPAGFAQIPADAPKKRGRPAKASMLGAAPIVAAPKTPAKRRGKPVTDEAILAVLAKASKPMDRMQIARKLPGKPAFQTLIRRMPALVALGLAQSHDGGTFTAMPMPAMPASLTLSGEAMNAQEARN